MKLSSIVQPSIIKATCRFLHYLIHVRKIVISSMQEFVSCTICPFEIYVPWDNLLTLGFMKSTCNLCVQWIWRLVFAFRIVGPSFLRSFSLVWEFWVAYFFVVAFYNPFYSVCLIFCCGI
jgi:hypothetical protein